MPDLHPPEHQVAGHRASASKLGPLIDGSGLFYKPLQAGDRGEHEVAFYEAFSAHAAVPARIRDTFFPRFHGTRLLPTEAQPGEPHPHLVLDDLLAGFEAPCVADIKIGAITWPPSSPEPYIAKYLAKDRGTTSVLLGFRVLRPSRRPRGRRVADGAPGGEGYGHRRRPPRAPALRVIRLPTRGWTARSRRRCTEEKVESCHSCASSRHGWRSRLCSTSTRRRFFWAMMLLQSQQAEVGVG
ncbi:Succinate--CoA ligase [ADP-forming] subunit beta mitochondrial [Zea mays]|nr:unknown [Zea mays]AQK84672.1 Succinate--CoA ligase [ADP-forming] subunit beta mitochondrial [Zea mays]AQK84676.1 Succinate--CoA ligase [ADP-forming] subunit beta mitochondrial [Zea mays]AQK84677.1 Succinate--CoA ligase [ADP-forming] subunit beta mitochondrial [Zea mays]AQK84678.1 Succinate--CoA ligase [ADP-forming] subunit beta mitochondrial [Zea mays]|eukprot:XP_008649440.2 inositol polyphosphate multikinase IPK2 [Zea mays]